MMLVDVMLIRLVVMSMRIVMVMDDDHGDVGVNT